MNITLYIGVIGAYLILVAFFLNQTQRLTVEDIKYDVLNAFGSGLMVVYAVLLASVPFLILNLVWTLVSCRDILKYVMKRKI